ncbi:uncharacterized protein Z520_02219 [Fonsecaea multimorphosa CBS 102226]|uniref:Heterokaryon incompatibility domain-containing protein n=1 Tax=Fonsecaea multimorphosa CBS 102226 TaxID=1442371 RepID=A0A0D2HJL5_9EURO|nr:uncharacterized protein Z520_02219 [Fonsecaea multimorphosa CBS 102226]KIY02081.1 hypothetical protein Z520_02219 [Fonsecaea multimorphosa CBS 102226]OAL29280.1 hypothetical protein AYO22_02174 [Fonsecaea multimorphosa]
MSHTNSNVFASLPLGEHDIRLLNIISDYDSELIHCELHNECLDLKAPKSRLPHYNALSYMWGSAECEKTTYINGLRLKIRMNLWEFLRRYQYDNISTPIWIDALCIDQGSIEERNHQVQRMGIIYKHARRVLVWLGAEKLCNPLALEVPSELKNRRKPSPKRARRRRSTWIPAWRMPMDIPELQEIRISPLSVEANDSDWEPYRQTIRRVAHCNTGLDHGSFKRFSSGMRL